MIQSIYSEMESASPARTASNTYYYSLQIRVGLRASATKRLMPLLQEFLTQRGASVVAHCFDTGPAGTLFVLIAKNALGQDYFPNDFNVWCEQAIDRICSDFPWDGVPLVYDPTQPPWSESTIYVTCSQTENQEGWFETYKSLCIFPPATWSSLSQVTFGHSFTSRYLLKSVIPVSIFNYAAAFRDDCKTVPRTALLQTVTDEEERAVLLEKAGRLRETHQLKLLPEELSPIETELFVPLMDRLGSVPAPANLGECVDVLRSLLNLMGYSAKEQDYLLLLGLSACSFSDYEQPSL